MNCEYYYINIYLFFFTTNVYDETRFVDQNLMLSCKVHQNRNFRNIDQKFCMCPNLCEFNKHSFKLGLRSVVE